MFHYHAFCRVLLLSLKCLPVLAVNTFLTLLIKISIQSKAANKNLHVLTGPSRDMMYSRMLIITYITLFEVLTLISKYYLLVDSFAQNRLQAPGAAVVTGTLSNPPAPRSIHTNSSSLHTLYKQKYWETPVWARPLTFNGGQF